jgi:hypothetical protein
MGTCSSLVSEDWDDVLAWLPPDLEEMASSSGSIQRRRSVDSASLLLRIALAYSVLDLSLRSTAAWLAGVGLGSMSDVAILKRLRTAPPFLEALLSRLLSKRIQSTQGCYPFKLRLIDATCVNAPGNTGAEWRIHMTYDPLQSKVTHVEITDEHGGEHLGRCDASPGELIVADRGYQHADRILEADAIGAQVLLRIGHQAVRMFDSMGRRLDPVDCATDLFGKTDTSERILSVAVWLEGSASKRRPTRLIIIRKSREATQRELRRLQLVNRRKGRKISERSKEAAAFTFLLTTVCDPSVSDQELAELYRVRWQIELAFKRLKSLMNLDALRARDAQLARTYLLGKLICAVLMDVIAEECRDFSPWGIPLGGAQSLARGGLAA